MSDANSASSDSGESAPSVSPRAASPESEPKPDDADERSDQQDMPEGEKPEGSSEPARSVAEGDPEPQVETWPVYDSDGVHVTLGWGNNFSEDETTIAWDFVVIPGVYGSWLDYMEPGPGAGSSKWLNDYVDTSTGDRVIRFEYDSKSLFSGSKCREAIRSCAMQLLRGLTSVRKSATRKRVIVFVTYDLGGIIVKDALVAASLDPASWSDVLDLSRVLVFNCCPHRSKNQIDMEDRLCRFLFASYDEDVARFTPSASSLPALAAAITEINGLFVDSKALLRNRAVSIYAGPDSAPDINRGFDNFAATLGVPFEKRIPAPSKEEEKFPGLTTYLNSLTSVLNVGWDDDVFLRERKLLSVASPIDPFRTTRAQDAPVTERPEFKKWLELPGPQILYIHGSHGVRNAAEQVFFALDEREWKQTTAVFYFSFNHWDVRRDSVRDMASTFLAQIICQFPHNKEWATGFFAQLDFERGWTEADLVYWLERFRFNDVFEEAIYVINYFDECTKGSRKSFLQRFKYLAGRSEGPYKIVVTSHRAGALESELSDTALTMLDLSAEPGDAASSPIDGPVIVRVDEDDMDGEVTRLTQLRPDLRLHESQLREELAIIANIDPLARHIIREQARVQPEWPASLSIRNMLGNLELAEGPWDDAALAPLLDRILRGIPAEANLGLLLSWILYSVRPLTVWELGTAMCLGSGADNKGLACPPPSTLDIFIRNLRVWLAGIADVEHNEVRIAHPRLRNILMGKSPRRKGDDSGPRYLWDDVAATAHFDITRLCLEYLSRPGLSEAIGSTYRVAETAGAHIFADRESLAPYALQAWTHHFLKVASSEDRSKLAAQFASADLGPDWARGHWALSNPVTRARASPQSLFPIFAGLGLLDVVKPRDEQDARCGLLEAASKGQSHTVKRMLRHAKFPEATLLDALVAAAASGDEQLILDLIQHISSKSDQPDAVAWPPSLIYRAAWLGLDRAAEKLLKLGVSPDPDVPWTAVLKASPLFQAGRNFHHATIRVLVEHGADITFLETYGRTVLHRVALLGNVEITRWMLESGKFDIEAKNEDGRTPIYFAAVHGHHAAVKELLDHGADPNMGLTPESATGAWFPLVVAAENGFPECVRLLLQHKANPNIPGPTEQGTAILYAAINGHVECCRILLEEGADPNSRLIEPPILIQVVQSLSEKQAELCLEIVRLLIDNKADVNAKDSGGSPVLARVVEFDNTDSVCELLLDRGADVNLVGAENKSPLFLAANNGKPALVKLFLERDADFRQTAEDGMSIIYTGVPNAEVTRLLLEAGADPNTVQDGGYTPLMFAAWFPDYLETLKLLIQHNAALEAQYAGDTDYKDKTALNIAVIEGSVDAVRELAEAGANLQHKGDDGVPALHDAATRGPEKLGVFLEFVPRLDLNQTNKQGQTALHLLDVSFADFKHLIHAGAALDVQDNEGVTPLGSHADTDHLDYVRYLVRRGADTNLFSRNYGSPLHRAARRGDLDMVKALVEAADKAADVNLAVQGAGTPLMAACLYYDDVDDDKGAEVIQYLLDHGAEADGGGPGQMGYPINAAALKAAPPIIDLLLSKGARADVTDSLGRAPVHFAAYYKEEMLQKILDVGGDARARDALGRTPLHWAAQAGRIGAVRLLLSYLDAHDDAAKGAGAGAGAGADIDATDKDGWTALCWAARGPHGWHYYVSQWELIEVVRLLLERGANRSVVVTTAQGQRWTPLKIARYHNAPAEVIGLLRHGSAWDTEELYFNYEKREEAEKKLGSNPDDESKGAMRQGTLNCDACLAAIYGFEYCCKECDWYHLCFKCYPHRELAHTPGHEFEEKGPEFPEEEPEAEAEPEAAQPDQTTESSSSTTDSDTDSDAES